MRQEAGAPLRAWIRALEAVGAMSRTPSLTLAAMLDERAATDPDRPALLGQREGFTYRELAERSNQIAHWVQARLAGQTIGLLMPNRPAYVAIWLGLTRAGCVVALLNTNLTGDALLHCIRAAGCALVLADEALIARLPDGVEALAWSALARELADEPASPPEHQPDPSDPALLVFTSGTTGLPKAARVSHGRITEWALWFAGMMDVAAEDRLYNCLPLYHSTGGIVAVGAMLARGASVLIAPGFSASRFWDEVADGGCTLFLYIGELCRYLAHSPAHPRERAHRLRLACGNGLHADVWARFRDRFAIPQILEFYAATEGSVSLYNCEQRPGAIGRVPAFLAPRFPLALIRVDAETGQPVRDADGRCIRCVADEPGEAIGRVDRASSSPARRFDGYTDPEASSRKLLRDVFAPNDCWFRSGDLMRRDASGFYYFIDRMGDTFRWKGENVSASEVAAAVRTCPGVADAAVYGVAVPGQEGRAGMAAIVGSFDPAVLWPYLAARLPGYAQPLFVRSCRALDLTGTFKLATAGLAREGFAGSADPVWFNNRRAYVPCDAALLRGIAAGTVQT